MPSSTFCVARLTCPAMSLTPCSMAWTLDTNLSALRPIEPMASRRDEEKRALRSPVRKIRSSQSEVVSRSRIRRGP
ncbi:MAG: hypothetical protein M5R42_03435 [Rhodocyclaceae bacterium]|nr:hypothetical protein [Rhodocyclaceae bacterium]